MFEKVRSSFCLHNIFYLAYLPICTYTSLFDVSGIPAQETRDGLGGLG